jgi:hypothetical protein
LLTGRGGSSTSTGTVAQTERVILSPDRREEMVKRWLLLPLWIAVGILWVIAVCFAEVFFPEEDSVPLDQE